MSAAQAFTIQGPYSRQYGTLTTIEGCEVIELSTGRAVAWRDSRASAQGVAHRLNSACTTGGQAIETVLMRVR